MRKNEFKKSMKLFFGQWQYGIYVRWREQDGEHKRRIPLTKIIDEFTDYLEKRGKFTP